MNGDTTPNEVMGKQNTVQQVSEPRFDSAHAVLKEAVGHAFKVGQANPKSLDVDTLDFSLKLQIALHQDLAGHDDSKMRRQFRSILSRYCGERGDNEGLTETLERVVREREILLRNGIKHELLKLK